ncbi:MAG: SMC-Scp complex subunit ScpB [Bacteroidota bacterium]
MNPLQSEETVDASMSHDIIEEPQGEGLPDSIDDAAVSDALGAEEATDPEIAVDEEEVTDGEAEDESFEEEDPDFRGMLEALIFASDEPLTFKQIKELLAPNENESDEKGEEQENPVRGRRKKVKTLTITRAKRAIDWLNNAYAEQGRSFRIIEVSGGFAFQTTGEYGAWVGRLFAERSRRRLTQSALETLAIIAFRQPISKPSVEGIRGVNAEYVVKSLLERNLISIVGREDSPGRPLLYGTTKTFLKHFGLSSINDLPKPREIKDLLSSEDELMSNPIDEMDPDKAVLLTRVSSQELEKLFDNARLRVHEPVETAASPEAGEERDGAGSGDTEQDTSTMGPVENNGLTAPVLHVQFDSDTDEVGDKSVNDGDDDFDDNEEIDEMEEDLPTEDTPFDEESPDEQESI